MKERNIITDLKTTSIKEVFGGEVKFTDKFLVKREYGTSLLNAAGINTVIDDIDTLECQIGTSDGKWLDNLYTLKSGKRIAIEAQLGKSDMTHISKLPYYMDNISKSGESMTGILVAEEITQEAINYYDRISTDDFKLYIIKVRLLEINNELVFDPQLIWPTATTNFMKDIKHNIAIKTENKSNSENYKHNKTLLLKFFREQNIKYEEGTASWGNFFKTDKEYDILLSYTGGLRVEGDGPPPNEYFIATGKKFTLNGIRMERDFNKFLQNLNLFIENL